MIPYWVNTSSNKMIKQAMQDCDSSFKEGYEELIRTGTVNTLVNFEASFYELKETNSLWGLFVNAGYLTIKEITDALEGKYVLKIPNNEIKREFQSLTAYYFHLDESSVAYLLDNFQNKNWDAFISGYRNILKTAVSYLTNWPPEDDLINENSYQTLLLGLFMQLDNKYEIISNRERGSGRLDILLKSKLIDRASFLIELKYTKDANVNLKELAQKGFQQILDKEYAMDMENVMKIGMAHCGKQVEIYVGKDAESIG